MIDFIANANGYAPLILLSPLLLAMLAACAYLVRLNSRVKAESEAESVRAARFADLDEVYGIREKGALQRARKAGYRMSDLELSSIPSMLPDQPKASGVGFKVEIPMPGRLAQ